MNKKVLSYDEIMTILANVARRQDETAKRQAEFDRWLAESEKRREEADAKRKEEDAKKLDDFERQLAEKAREIDRDMKKLKQEIGGIGAGNGKMAVDLIISKLKKKKMFGGIAFDEIWKEVERKGKDRKGNELTGEYDIIMLNGTSAALIDVKYRVRKGDLDYLIDEQLPKFRKLFYKYRKFKAYLGLGGLSFADGVVNLAKRNGVGVINLDGNIVKIDDKGVTAK